MKPGDKDRVGKFIEPIGCILHPLGCVLLCIAGWSISYLLSKEAIGMAYVWMGIGLIIFCIQIERSWLNTFPFPPLTTLVFAINFRGIAGGTLLLLSGGNEVNSILARHIQDALPINFIPSASLVFMAWAINSRYINNRNNKSRKWSEQNEQFKKTILCTTLVTGIIGVGYIYVGAFGGTLDRGASYLAWAGKFWRPDTVFSALIRLRDVFFVCLPLCIYLYRKQTLILALLLTPTISALALSVGLGGRGLLLYPLVLLAGGLWLAGINPKKLKLVIVVLGIFAIIYVGLIGQIRNTKAFSASSSADIGERIMAIASATKEAKMLNRKIFDLEKLGFAMYTHSDPYLFTEPTASSEPAGNRRLENLKYLWIPRLAMKNRPEINDGHLIANEIRNTPTGGMRDGRYISFHNVSFGGDLYWRYRWKGVIIGSILLGVIYAYACRFWYQNASFSGKPMAVLLALFPATFFQGPPLRSLSETAWNWLYEFPKYFVVCFLLGIAIQALVKKKQIN